MNVMNVQMARLIYDLRRWRSTHASAAESPAAKDALKALLCPNREILEDGIAIVEAMTIAEMDDLRREHYELNVAEGVDVRYAADLVQEVCDRDDREWDLHDTDDYVNVLK